MLGVGVEAVKIWLEIVFCWVFHVVRVKDIILIEEIRVDEQIIHDSSIVEDLELMLEVDVSQKHVGSLAFLFEVTGRL